MIFLRVSKLLHVFICCSKMKTGFVIMPTYWTAAALLINNSCNGQSGSCTELNLRCIWHNFRQMSWPALSHMCGIMRDIWQNLLKKLLNLPLHLVYRLQNRLDFSPILSVCCAVMRIKVFLFTNIHVQKSAENIKIIEHKKWKSRCISLSDTRTDGHFGRENGLNWPSAMGFAMTVCHTDFTV